MSVEIITFNNGNINTNIYSDLKIYFHGKFYVTIGNKNYKLVTRPNYAENTDRLLLVCSKLRKDESVNNYGEPDCLLTVSKKTTDTIRSSGDYVEYDWEYTPLVESKDDHLCYFIKKSDLSENSLELADEIKEAGMSANIYLKETKNKSIWKNGTPVYVKD